MDNTRTPGIDGKTAIPRADQPTVRTTFGWERSPSFNGTLNTEGSQAAILAKVAINGKEVGDQSLPADATEITIEAKKDDHIVVFICYRNEAGVVSKARGFDIYVDDRLTPDPIGEIRVSKVAKPVNLPVLS